MKCLRFVIMKRLYISFVLIFSILIFSSCSSSKKTSVDHSKSHIDNPNFYLADNGVTVMCPIAAIGDKGTVNGVTYTKRNAEDITPENASTSCTSGITSLQGLFKGHADFNGDISTWDVSSVTTMADMFNGAKSFNADISAWDVSSVTSFTRMFAYASSFNANISQWNTKNLIRLIAAFSGATSFNQDISDWNVSKVRFMNSTFKNAKKFNQDLSTWCVENVNTYDNFNTQSGISANHLPKWGQRCTK